MVYTHDSKSCEATHAGPTPAFGTSSLLPHTSLALKVYNQTMSREKITQPLLPVYDEYSQSLQKAEKRHERLEGLAFLSGWVLTSALGYLAIVAAESVLPIPEGAKEGFEVITTCGVFVLSYINALIAEQITAKTIHPTINQGGALPLRQ